MALAFIPENEIIATFKVICSTASNTLGDFINYYGRTYIGVYKNTDDEWIDTAPRFDISRWNCYNTTISNGRRTNNVVEGWHSKFTFYIITKHTSIWKFKEFIQKNERDNSILINQLIGGHRLIRHSIKKNILSTMQEFLKLLVDMTNLKPVIKLINI